MPTLDDLRSRTMPLQTDVSGSDIVPVFDVSEAGNSPIKRATVSSIVAAGLSDDAEAIREAIGIQEANVSDYGTITIGTGVSAGVRTANRQAIQAAIDSGKPVHLDWEGVVEIDDELVIVESGTRISGRNAETTKISQTTDAAHGISIELGGTATVWGPQTRRVTLEHFGLYSTGAATSTGRGINIDGTATLVGQSVNLNHLTIRGWGLGYYNRRCDQSTMLDCVVAYCSTGIDADTSANSFTMINTGVAQCLVEGVVLGATSGNNIIGGDYGNQPRSFRIKAGNPVNIIGGNFESINGAGTEAILIESNGQLNHTGARFLLGSGNDVPPYRVSANAFLGLHDCDAVGGYTDLVIKAATAVVVGSIGSSSLSAPKLMTSTDGDKTAVIPFPTLRDDAGLVATAGAATRGQLFYKASRSGTADDLILHYRTAAGTFSVANLTGRAAAGANTDLTTVTGLNLGSVSNPPIRSTSGGSTTGVYFSTNTVGLTSSSTATFIAAAGAASIPVASVSMAGLPVYADNAAAVSGGLAAGRIYRTATGELRIVIP